MKLTNFTTLLTIGLVLTFAASGCRKRPGYMTRIPPGKTLTPPEDADKNAAEKAGDKGGDKNPTEHPLPDPNERKDWPRDRDAFKAYTAHFDFDSSVVKAADKPNVAAVADYLKSNAHDAVEIEGHCDERGTEEYNRSLGERRALALRESLIALGIDPGKIDTISYGKDRPVDPGHDEAAWKQNRRGEFILEKHPAAP
jgi:peptidoglycan-associated lipoprotein